MIQLLNGIKNTIKLGNKHSQVEFYWLKVWTSFQFFIYSAKVLSSKGVAMTISTRSSSTVSIYTLAISYYFHQLEFNKYLLNELMSKSSQFLKLPQRIIFFHTFKYFLNSYYHMTLGLFTENKHTYVYFYFLNLYCFGECDLFHFRERSQYLILGQGKGSYLILSKLFNHLNPQFSLEFNNSIHLMYKNYII